MQIPTLQGLVSSAQKGFLGLTNTGSQESIGWVIAIYVSIAIAIAVTCKF